MSEVRQQADIGHRWREGSASVDAPKRTNGRIDCSECVACSSKALAIFSEGYPPLQSRAGPYEAAMEMDMFYRLVTAGAAVCAFSLLGFTGQADATTRSTLKASPSLTILAQNSENSEVQNLLEPQSDSGFPGGPSQPMPEGQPAGGEMQAQPQGGGGGETNAIDQEEGK